MWDLLLTHGIVVTVDKNHTEYNDGFVAVQGERICAIGHMSELPQDYSAKKQIDCSGHVIMPGLVDAHGHAGHSLIRSLGDGKPGTLHKTSTTSAQTANFGVPKALWLPQNA